MIKKKLKTLQQLQQPSTFGRLYYPDGTYMEFENELEATFITNGLVERGHTIRDIGNGNYEAFYGNRVLTPDSQQIVDDVAEYENNKTFKEILKEDFGGWDKENFNLKLNVTLICVFIFFGISRLTGGIKGISLSGELLFWVICCSSGLAIGWLLPKLWKLSPYITSIIKIAGTLQLIIILYIFIGIINYKLFNKICSYIGPYLFSKREKRTVMTFFN